MQITDNSVVNIHYTLTNDAGNVLDSSEGREPLAYLHGHHQIIPGLENALVGKSAGDELNVTIAPEDAYGLRVEEAVQTVPREAFAQIPDLAVGMQLHGESPQGPMSVVVKEVNDDNVVVDANHPLAGMRLRFKATVTDIRPATHEEIEHGHAHGEHDHHH